VSNYDEQTTPMMSDCDEMRTKFRVGYCLIIVFSTPVIFRDMWHSSRIALRD